MKPLFKKILQLIALELAQIAIVKIADRFLGDKNLPIKSKKATDTIQEIDATKT